MKESQNIHANGMIFDGVGIIIRGASGSGKSLLTLSLLQFACVSRKRAALVGDDRLEIFQQNCCLIMRVPDSIAGKIELAGRGIISCEHEKTSSVDLVVDLVDDYQRMPGESQFSTSLLGIKIPACPVPNLSIIGLEHQRLLVLEAIGQQQKIISLENFE